MMRLLIPTVLDHAMRTPDRMAILEHAFGRCTAKRYTYEAMVSIMLRLAARLQDLAPTGSRILIMNDKSAEFALSFLACLAAGMIAVPSANPTTTRFGKRVEYVAENAGIAACLVSNHLYDTLFPEMLSQDPKDTKQVLFPDMLEKIIPHWVIVDDYLCPSGHQNAPALPKISTNDTAFLQYTSGSTQAPRGVMVSHNNLVTNIRFIEQQFGFTARDKMASWLPLYHDMGLIGGVLAPLYLGFPTHLMGAFEFISNPQQWLELIHHYRATVSGAPNFAYANCLANVCLSDCQAIDLSSWELAYCGAEPIHPKTLEAFWEKFRVLGLSKHSLFPAYGLAENTLVVSGNELSNDTSCKNSLLLCVPTTSSKILPRLSSILLRLLLVACFFDASLTCAVA